MLRLALIVFAAAAAAQDLRVLSVTQITQSGRGDWAAVSADGAQLAYLDNGRIVVRDVATSALKPVSGSLYCDGLTFAPDGRSLYFASRGMLPTRTLAHLTLPDGNIEQTPLEAFGGVAVSPDGKRIAYLRREDASHRALYVAALDGKGERKIASWKHANYSFYPPAWSPEGDRIAVHSEKRAISAVTVATGEIHTLGSVQSGDISFITWPASGNGLFATLFQEAPRGAAPTQIWHLALSSGKWTQVTHESMSVGGAPSLSADGKLLVTTRQTSTRDFWDGLLGLFGLHSPHDYEFRSDVVVMRMGQ